MNAELSKINLIYSRSILPETGFLRLPAVLSLIPIGKTTWWNGVKTGRFPAPVKLGPRITAWRAEDIHAYIAQSNQAAYPKDASNSKGGDALWK
jgi:predicted DNA-binding transcriptional regulator AlpA